MRTVARCIEPHYDSGSNQTSLFACNRAHCSPERSHEVSSRCSMANCPAGSSSEQDDREASRPKPEATSKLHTRPVPCSNPQSETAIQYTILGTIRCILRQMETRRPYHRPALENDAAAANPVFRATTRGTRVAHCKNTLSQGNKNTMAQTSDKY